MFTLYKRSKDKPVTNDNRFDSIEDIARRDKYPGQSIDIGFIHQIYDDIFADYSSLGSYPLIFIDDCDILCAKCAKHRLVMENKPITTDVYWEGHAEECEDCGTIIESAYGDPYETTED